MNASRRRFLFHSAGAVAATALIRSTATGAAGKPANKICLFEKPVQEISFGELAAFASQLGFDGLSATVRKGGHILPERVEEELPRLVDALARHKLEITELTTDITRPDDPDAERVLKTAAKLGVRLYRTGSLKYAQDRPIPEQVGQFTHQFKQLAALNRSLGIGGCYQVHAGANTVGAAVWDLWHMVKEHPVDVLGIAWDIRHATVEGGQCWPTNFRLARPHIGIVYAKDFAWQGRKAVNVPLGEGAVDAAFWRMLTTSGYTGPINLHVEHPLPRDREGVTAAIRKDMETLRSWLGR